MGASVEDGVVMTRELRALHPHPQPLHCWPVSTLSDRLDSPSSALLCPQSMRALCGGQSDLSGVSGLRMEMSTSRWEGFSAHFTDKINQI